ncbi:hypothetical protein KEJ34_04265 [Candidatus Bathyarchaeota archaeon]|nr:hypothetical protein [Candidatus Bathyarchaeota archaeon]
MVSRFCIECENFEDRMEIDGVVLCARGHRPGVACQEFQDRFEGGKATASKTRFCIECKNFEDRTDIDGVVVCARGHYPGVSCLEFRDRTVDIFYSYIYWSYLYSTGNVDEGKAYWEAKLSKRLSPQELAYAVLMEYFSLGLDQSHFIRCWNVARKIYGQKMPFIKEILDAALERHKLFGERTDLKRVFSDLLYTGKSSGDVVVGISKGFYKGGVINHGE